MSIHGAPLPPRSCLDRGTRSPTNDSEVNAMRAAAWHRHGVAALPVAEINFLQAVVNLESFRLQANCMAHPLHRFDRAAHRT